MVSFQVIVDNESRGKLQMTRDPLECGRNGPLADPGSLGRLEKDPLDSRRVLTGSLPGKVLRRAAGSPSCSPMTTWM